jgi:hypothetical protein
MFGFITIQMNKELGAQAFTHGNDIYLIKDIDFSMIIKGSQYDTGPFIDLL